MGTALDDHLRSKRTPQEEIILLEWKNRAAIHFSLGFAGGSTVAWLATQALRSPLRRALTFGAGTVCGGYLLLRSVESYVDRVLSLKGSRMQRQLADIMLKDPDNLWIQKCLSKHFFAEKVYVDSSVDRAILRWRYRGSFIDPLAHFQTSSFSEETDSKENNIEKAITTEPKQVNVSSGDNALGYPFDSVLGLAESTGDAPQLEAPKALSRREKHRERRYHRRHRQQLRGNDETDT